MSKHYLVLTFAVGKDSVRREHHETRSETTLDEAVDSWVVAKLHGRQRNRAKAEAKLRASIIGARIARPTSHYREQIEARESRGIDHDAIQQAIQSGRKRRVRYAS